MPSKEAFSGIKFEGTLLTQEFVRKMLEKNSEIIGINPEDYWLSSQHKLHEEISRAWDTVIKFWQLFQLSRKQQSIESATTTTRERWLLPFFQALEYGRLTFVRSLDTEGIAYAISHVYKDTPIHLISDNHSLDSRIETRYGTGKLSAHSLVQGYLNNNEKVRWGIVSNGLKLRLLRDNANVARMSYIEFDLEGIMNSGAYRDFSALWMILHASRVTCLESSTQGQNWLDIWFDSAKDQGLRMRDKLCIAAQKAVEDLGTGMLSNANNELLRNSLQNGLISPDEFKRQLLRLIYRLIFIFVAEDRDLLLQPESKETKVARDIYIKYYNTRDIRFRSRRLKTDKHIDLWERIKVVMTSLYNGRSELALPAFGSELWDDSRLKEVIGCKIENTFIFKVIFSLCWTRESDEALLAVDWRNMGSEELGSIYEVLLELVVDVNLGNGSLELISSMGNDRKSTGSYYTRSDLISNLLDSALEPIIKRAVTKRNSQEAENALLNLKICDPACGSGHFLVAAAHRMARHLSNIRNGDVEAPPNIYRHALRDIVSKCLYGVDINPLSVELTKIALWLESMEAGNPLSFLDHHIQCGNSLIGATPALIEEGIPSDAISILTGDDKEISRALKKKNREELKTFKQFDMFGAIDNNLTIKELLSIQRNIDELSIQNEDSLKDVHIMQDKWKEYQESEYIKWQKLIADIWCSSFVQHKRPEEPQITNSTLRLAMLTPQLIDKSLSKRVAELSKQYQFFHWHLRFPDVFKLPAKKQGPSINELGWTGGFDVVLGNPPWDKIKLAEIEWFSHRNTSIAKARTKADREKMVKELPNKDPHLFALFQNEKRIIEGNSHYAHNSGCFKRSAIGDVNTYVLFSELNEIIIKDTGMAGFIVPSGIATDKGTSVFFSHLVTKGKLVSLFSFENRKGLFPDVDSRQRFALTTIAGGNPPIEEAKFAFSIEQVSDLKEEGRIFSLTKDEFDLFNPNTGNCPTFKNVYEKSITKKLYKFPVLVREAKGDQKELNPWGIEYKRLFDMAIDSYLFRTREQLEDKGYERLINYWHDDEIIWIPLYEGKNIYIYDNRFASYENATISNYNSGQLPQLNETDHIDPWKFVLPDYWISEQELQNKLSSTETEILALRDITNSTNKRTGIFSMVPNVGFGNKIPILLSINNTAKGKLHLLASILSSYCFDWACRLSVGGVNLTLFILKQLPVPDLSVLNEKILKTLSTWESLIHPIAVELYYTSWDMYLWAKNIKMDSPPYVWDESRRYYLKCCIDAACFLLYGIYEENELIYIMDSFKGIKNDEIETYGSYKTLDVILQIQRWLKNAKGIITADIILESLNFPCEWKARLHPIVSEEQLKMKMPWVKFD